MRIGVIVPDRRPNPLYRALWPMQELARRGHTIGVAVAENNSQIPSLASMSGFDVIYFWQLYADVIRRLARGLRRAGVAVIWDSDDDVLSIPKGSPNYKEAGGILGQRLWADMRRMIALCDAVTTPSPVLAEKYSAVGQQHVHVIENLLPGIPSVRRRPNAGKTVVGWFGLAEHVTDVDALGLRQVFGGLIDARPEVHVETVGVNLGLEHPRYRCHGYVEYASLAPLIARFDVGLAPLADTPFNRSRSNIKLKEYAAAGVPWLASAVEPYAGIDETHGGRLVDNERWLDAIVDLIDDQPARLQLAEDGMRWAGSETLKARGDEWEEILVAAVERARRRAGLAPAGGGTR